VVYRKGELSKTAIDRGWPHQVAIEERFCTGHQYYKLRFFCEGEGLSLCSLGHCFFRDETHFNVFCFAQRAHAELFSQRFGGELMHAKDRPRWPAG
jgi:hypothetical protein